MVNLKLLGAGAAAGALACGIVVWPIAHGMGADGARRAAQVRQAAAERVINRTLVERNQAQAEVAKVNAAMAAQATDLAALRSADEAERASAMARMEQAVNVAAREAKRAGEQAYATREAIKTVADACARAGVDPAIVRMLNDLIGPAPALRDGGLPANAGGDRP